MMKKFLKSLKVSKKDLKNIIIGAILGILLFTPLYDFIIKPKLIDIFYPKPQILISVQTIRYVSQPPDYWNDLFLSRYPFCSNPLMMSYLIEFSRVISGSHSDVSGYVNSSEFISCPTCTEYIVTVKNNGNGIANEVVISYTVHGKIIDTFLQDANVQKQISIGGINESEIRQSMVSLQPDNKLSRLGFLSNNFENIIPNCLIDGKSETCQTSYYESFIYIPHNQSSISVNGTIVEFPTIITSDIYNKSALYHLNTNTFQWDILGVNPSPKNCI